MHATICNQQARSRRGKHALLDGSNATAAQGGLLCKQVCYFCTCSHLCCLSVFLSLQSMQYYSLWQAGQDGQQILQDGNAAALTAGSDLRSFGSSGLLRLSSNASTAGRASLRESGTGDADQTVPAVQAVQAVQAPQGEGSMRVGSAVLGSSRSGSQNQLHPLVPGVVPGVVPSVVPVVPCSIYFPGNRRTSKTLAVAVHGGSALPEEGATTAPWLRPIATASVAAAAAAAASCSAVSDAVEVHRKLAAAQQRLDVLVQQLQDKEDLLKEARQMVSGGLSCCSDASLCVFMLCDWLFVFLGAWLAPQEDCCSYWITCMACCFVCPVVQSIGRTCAVGLVPCTSVNAIFEGFLVFAACCLPCFVCLSYFCPFCLSSKKGKHCS